MWSRVSYGEGCCVMDEVFLIPNFRTCRWSDIAFVSRYWYATLSERGLKHLMFR